MPATTKQIHLHDVPMGNEQRQHTRYLCLNGGQFRLAIRPEFRGRRAMVVDVSVGGIAFLLPEALAMGTVIAVELQAAGGGAPFSRLARVRHCQPHPVPDDAPWLAKPPMVLRIARHIFGLQNEEADNNAWLIGCEFDQRLGDHEVQPFASDHDAGSGRNGGPDE